jgi:hypothetical protein
MSSFVSSLKMILTFGIVISMLSLPGPISSSLHFPSVSLVTGSNNCGDGLPGPVFPCPWVPAGPSMDTEQVQIFTDAPSEFACLQQSPSCTDLTDSPLPPNLTCPKLCPLGLAVSLPVPEQGYDDIQFMLANNFWGCDFNYGNSACGIQIRQGIAHLIDKVAFIKAESSIAGIATAIDNPVPAINGVLPTPNPCAWDSSFPETTPNCVVGALGGTGYHLKNATGANGVAWYQAPGSPDLNAAAQHFVNAGIATGFNNTTSILTGINSTAATHAINIYIRNDDQPRLDLGTGLAVAICYLFGQGFATRCSYVTGTSGGIGAFPGFITSTTTVKLDWWIYTGSYLNIYSFDKSLYGTYNSQFVSGISAIKQPNRSCSASSVPTSSAADYMYLCNPNYDSSSGQMEFSPCPSSSGDPTPGQPNNGPGGNCTGTSQLSSISAGVQTEDSYGKGEYSIPVFTITGAQYGYLSNWQRVMNGDGVGIPNFFTWLNAYSPNPAVAGTFRQGFAESPLSLNPYLAESAHDFYVVRNIYDSLGIQNPDSAGQLIDWMAIYHRQLPLSMLPYAPPAGTVSSLGFTLRADLYFQDGRRVTSFDVAFSLLSMIANGAFQSSQLSSIAGITILGPTQFDINLKGLGPSTLLSLTSVTILPGRYWSSAGSGAWDNEVVSCMIAGPSCYPAQYTLGPIPASGPPPTQCALTCAFPTSSMNVDPVKITPSFNPVAAGILVGSGPWECASQSGTVGGGCGATGCPPICPPGSGPMVLTRFGKGFPPNSPPFDLYFRSAGNLALWIWTGNRGLFTQDFVNFATMAACFNLPVTSSAPCAHFQRGIGSMNGTTGPPASVGINQILAVDRFVGLNWVNPFDWANASPTGLIPLSPVLYEGGLTLNPCSIDSVHGYDC